MYLSDTKNKTKLIHYARGDQSVDAFPVNPPVMRASTVLFKNYQAWEDSRERRKTDRVLSYGARGTETNFELEKLITELESGYRAQLFPSGLAALGMVLLHYAKSGGHILITDGIYGPIRLICDTYMKRFDVQIEFLKADCSDLKEKIKPGTSLLLCESPGSAMYELIDLPRISKIAHEHGIPVAIDNTYGSGYFYNPLKHGADISIIAATKYLCGHSDVVMGIVVCNESEFTAFNTSCEAMGMTVSPDDSYLVLRGMRTLDIRLRAHEKSALSIAGYLKGLDIVKQVFHPALKEHKDHYIWKRDFNGSNGMLTIELDASIKHEKVIEFIDELSLFGIGASWGGYESLATVIKPEAIRTQSDWSTCGVLVRFHIGLEDVEDLINDIKHSLNEVLTIRK